MNVKTFARRIVELSREKGLSGFLRYAIHSAAYNYYVKKRLPARCPVPPVALQIETSTVCNLRCRMCEYAYQTGKGRLMSLEEFKKIISKFPPTISLDLTGIGEPFCNPDFVNMVRFAKSRGASVIFSTNGILMKEAQMDDLIDIGVDTVSFSVDASTKETHEKIRAGSSFEKLIQNISLLSEKVSRSKIGRPVLQLTYTVSKDNLAEAEQFPQLARQVGVATICYRDMITFSGGGYSEADSIIALFDKELRSRIKDKILSEASRLGINAYPCESLTDSEGTGRKLCYRPWTTCFVDVNGNFYPCCRLTQHNIDITGFSFGNILEDELKIIWNTAKYQALRKGIVHPTQVPALCRGCNCLRK